MQTTIDRCSGCRTSRKQMADITHSMVVSMQADGGRHQRICGTSIANFDDFFRPIRNYFYWEPHCFDIPVCCGDAIGVRQYRRRRRA